MIASLSPTSPDKIRITDNVNLTHQTQILLFSKLPTVPRFPVGAVLVLLREPSSPTQMHVGAHETPASHRHSSLESV